MSIYVPSGYRLAETVFREFVSARFVQELKDLWEDFARIQLNMLVPARDVLQLASERPPMTMEIWHRNIEERFGAPCSAPSAPDDASPFAQAQAVSRTHYNDLLKHLLTAEAIERVMSDRETSGGPTSLERCLKLLQGGCWGYWERHKVDLTTIFREQFSEGPRRAFALKADGSMQQITAEWWRGVECTDALMSQSFRHPSGDILEKLLSPAEANDPHQRKLAATKWLHDHGSEVAGLPDEDRQERFRTDTGVVISPEGWRDARQEFLSQRPDLKRAFSRPGPRRQRRT